MKKIIAITIGDIRGIGIKILLNLFKKKQINNFILFTNKNIINQYLQENNIKINLNIITIKDKKLNYVNNKLNIFSYDCNSLEDNTYKSLKFSYVY